MWVIGMEESGMDIYFLSSNQSKIAEIENILQSKSIEGFLTSLLQD